MRDQRRFAPHLRNPKLVERYERLNALVATFEGDTPELRGDEMQCQAKWHVLRPFLEDARQPDGQSSRDIPRPSNASMEAIEVVDSQEQAGTWEDWASVQGDFMQGRKKRARVQGLGLGLRALGLSWVCN